MTPLNPYIFHITHVRNLPSMVADGFIWSDSQRIARQLQSTNIGYTHIKQRRLQRDVPVAAGGKLGDYVPFNFCSRSIMLYVVSQGHNDYSGGQDEIVHLYSNVATATTLGIPWAFTDLHADLAYARYFDNLQSLAQVDWRAMPLTQWGGNDEVKAKRQAEFLVHNRFPWPAILGIGVKDGAVAARVQSLIPSRAPAVTIQPDWYY